MDRNELNDPSSRGPGSSTSSLAPAGLGARHEERTGRPFGSPAAYLIQSAARSMLDEATPDTAVSGVSDDESDNDSIVDGRYGSLRSVDLSTLSSLQHRNQPEPIPNEQDRKRFIGCLAAILATSYDYDEPDDPASVIDLGSDNFAYLEYSGESLYDIDEDEDEKSDPGKLRQSTGLNNTKAQSFDSIQTQGSTDSLGSTRHLGETNSRLRNRGRSASERAKLATKRHRRRRYGVICDLLVTSSDLLLLDKSVARAFLPMLGRVLVPRNKVGTSETSSRPPLHGKRVGSQILAGSGNDEPSAAIQNSSQQSSLSGSDCQSSLKEYIPEEVDQGDVLRPFLESLTPGSGFRCLSLLILQHLLSSEVGYDSRIRHVLKKVGVIVLNHDMERDPVERGLLPGKGQPDSDAYAELSAHAARKFESLEHSIARRLIRLSESNKEGKAKGSRVMVDKGKNSNSGITREMLVRGVKIGSAGIVAGTLFALTGGLAAPGIAAGVAAVAGSTAVASAAVGLLSSTAVVTTIFGVGGGSLAAFKMQRRTQGLTEFEIRKETQLAEDGKNTDIDAELFSTICISGWLRDKYDFQRPWGIHPTNPRLYNRLELLQRFYSIHSPEHVPKCEKILASWEGEERELWAILHEKYGCTPDHLFPLDDGTRVRGALSLEQEEILDHIFVELGYNSAAPKQERPGAKQPTPFERMRDGWANRSQEKGKPKSRVRNADLAQASFHRYNSSQGSLVDQSNGPDDGEQPENQPPKHLTTVWDYASTYGGELYTVRWESKLLQTLCDCVVDMAVDVVTGATRQILKQTVLHTLLSAVIWPSYLLSAANVIDGDWTLAVERADQGGRELARSLLFSRAGRRPVVLIGFSFGARVIYSCLKELSRLQEDWEDYQELKQGQEQSNNREDNLRLAKLHRKFDGMREPASVVEDAIMMGLPNHLSVSSWRGCRQVVAGRLVNCYSTKDLILSLMFQAKRSSLGTFNPAQGVASILKPVCGTCPVPLSGVENIDISDLVSGHEDYCLVTGRILERVRHGQPLRHVPSTEVNSDTQHLEAKKISF